MATLLRYFFVTLSAALVVLVLLTFSPETRAENAAFSECTNEPSAQCLTDLGVDGDRAVLIYSTLTRIGAQLGDQEIQRMALERMADAALSSREFSELITTGYHWYQFENRTVE